MKRIHALLALVVLAGIAASLALAGTANRPAPSTPACGAAEACGGAAAGCEIDTRCDAAGGGPSETCGACGDSAATRHGAPAAKPASRPCCAG